MSNNYCQCLKRHFGDALTCGTCKLEINDRVGHEIARAEIERLRNLLIEALPWIGDIPADPYSMKHVNELIIEIQNEIDRVE
jgi:hypothetical protein